MDCLQHLSDITDLAPSRQHGCAMRLPGNGWNQAENIAVEMNDGAVENSL